MKFHKLSLLFLLILVPIVLNALNFDNEADLHRLLDEWDKDETPDPDELPEHLRPAPQIDFSKLGNTDPETLLKLTKKGKTLITFVRVDGNPSREETESITKLWQNSLHNNHIQAERYVTGDDQVIFLFKDGSQAWDAKDFLIKQDRCRSMTIENKVYENEKYKDRSEL